VTSPRTIRDLIERLSTLDPSMEVACIEDLDIAGGGADLRTVAGATVLATGPIGGGDATGSRRVLVLIPSGGQHAVRIAATEPWWTFGARLSGDAHDSAVECRRCHMRGLQEEHECHKCGFAGGAL